MGDMTMKEQFIKWMPVIALASFAAAVFLIADGYYWQGSAFVGAGASLSSAAAIYKKKNDSSDGDHETK
jgi:hypothetical protein